MEISSQEKLLIDIVKILNNLKIEYFITGGFAVSVWGRPRATFDIDIVVKMVEPDASILVKTFQRIRKAGYANEEAVKDAIRNQGEFNFIDPNSGLKVDFWVVKKNELNARGFKNKKIKKINGQKVFFSSPEDLILSKLEWYRECKSTRHIEDVDSVLKVSGKIIDKKYLKQQAKKIGLEEYIVQDGDVIEIKAGV